MSPTAAEITAATLTPLSEHISNRDAYNQKEKETAATAAAATTNANIKSKSVAELSQPLPPQIGSNRVGSDMLLMTPEQIAEAYESAVREEERKAAAAKEEEQNKKSRFNLLNFLKSLTELRIRERLLLIVGKFLSFILHLDMHGGDTGNNINFVEGLIDFLAGSLGKSTNLNIVQWAISTTLSY